jgi:hypothetical protein
VAADETDIVTGDVSNASRALVVNMRRTFPYVRLRERFANTFWPLPSGHLAVAPTEVVDM